jgi:hypothetical protein
MKITSDPILQRGSTKPCKDAEIFEQLTEKNNCIVLDNASEVNKVSQRLETWAKKHRPGCKVKTTSAYATDGKPRMWLVFPEAPKTAIRGPFPAAA